MNPFEDKLTQFVEDEMMFNAVKGALLAQCDLNEVSHRLPFMTTSNEQIGALVRGWEEARAIITFALKDLDKYRKQRTNNDTGENPV